MGTWGEILTEVMESAQQSGGNPDLDGIRRKYLRKLHEKTGRDTILYSTDWLGGANPQSSIVLEDMQGLMEVSKGLTGPELDVILHSPGGSAEATASLVRYLRKKFTDIRVFVPIAAMSAATMWALSANEIVMGKHSQVGPIDPQLVSPQGWATPARAVLEQFERAKRECAADPSVVGAWYPILQQYGTGLLDQCEKAEQLARRLVGEWLAAFMFVGEKDAKSKAEKVADYFADYGKHQSHNLGIDREEARAQGLNVTDLEHDDELQDAVLSVHHATIHTFAGAAVKIVENHLGKAFVKLSQAVQVQVPANLQMPGPQQPPQVVSPAGGITLP